MEGEARFKEEREPNEFQKTLNDPSQRPQQKVKTSHEHFQTTTPTPSEFSKQW
mgnify:CR=1 FL=1